MNLTEKDLFVVYSLPGNSDYYLVKQNNFDNHPSDSERKGFLIESFSDYSVVPPCFIYADSFLKNPNLEIKIQTTVKRKYASKAEYIVLLNQFIKDLNEGQIKKLVLSRILAVDFKNENTFNVFLKLKNLYPDVLVYFFNIPNIGTWIGATPERLLTWDEHEASTMALAGTRQLGDKNEWSQKNINEHRAVVDYISNTLRQNAYKYIKEEMTMLPAGNIEHLCTRFTIESSASFEQLVKRLHPTPAVCGFPLEPAKNYIHSHEGYDRRYYTGYLGPIRLHPKNHLFVNLRCMEIGENKAFIYVGGGLMPDSNAEQEWIETVSKAKTLRNVIM